MPQYSCPKFLAVALSSCMDCGAELVNHLIGIA